MTLEQKRLLSDEHEDAIDTESQGGERSTQGPFGVLRKDSSRVLLVVYSLLTTGLLIWFHLPRTSETHTPYSPVSNLIQPTTQNVYPKTHSKYSKEPSEELNVAWAELVAPMLIQASESELIAASEDPNERLELVQGGYLGSLGVFHELHCLRRLYWHMYDEIYFTNMTAADRDYERGHARHCIETLRLSLMCQANTALYTFEWDENGRKKQHLTSNAQRQCVEWGPIHEWASERSVGLNPQFYRPKKDVVV